MHLGNTCFRKIQNHYNLSCSVYMNVSFREPNRDSVGVGQDIWIQDTGSNWRMDTIIYIM
jgi:hypothetical protein